MSTLAIARRCAAGAHRRCAGAVARGGASWPPRRAAGSRFGGSIAGVDHDAAVAAARARLGPPIGGVLVRHAASGHRARLRRHAAVRVVSAWCSGSLPCRSRSTAAGTSPMPCSPVADGERRRGVQRAAGALETVFAADNVVTFLFAWELMSLATAALVATEHESRATAAPRTCIS